jgi:hypothetical protein
MQADYLAGNSEAARTALECLADPGPEALGLLALCRVRQALSHYPPGTPVVGPALTAQLAATFDHPRLEADRRFARGWLAWVGGDWEQAESDLLGARERHQAIGPEADGTEAAYWLARVRLLLRRADALAGFETVMRSRGGSPQLTCWYVDLLWRVGHGDRAEQVWKAVRTNRKIAAVDEAGVLEARALLRHGDTRAAELALAGAAPRGGVVRVERNLLLTWVLAERGHLDQAEAALRQAEAGPYPEAFLRSWRTLFDRRQSRGTTAREPLGPGEIPLSPGLAGWLHGQEARAAGRVEEAGRAYREVLADPRLRPFARYGLACLGEEDLARLLGDQPGLFLAVRCRARVMSAGFLRRDRSPAEVLGALEQARRLGYRTASLDHYHRLALALSRQSAAEDLAELAGVQPGAGPAVVSNCLRAAVEKAVRRLPPGEAIEWLLRWSRLLQLRDDSLLRQTVGLQLLRLLPCSIPPDPPDPEEKARAEAGRARAEILLGNHPRLALVRDWLRPAQAVAVALPPDAEPLVRLWRKACELKSGEGVDAKQWRQEVTELRSQVLLRGVAQALLAFEAARREDLAGLTALLSDAEAWQALPAGPPEFVVRAVESLGISRPELYSSAPVLARWLQCWDPAALSPAAQRLARRAGLLPPDPETDEPPPQVPLVPWLLHQAAGEIGRNRFRTALAWVRRALRCDPELRAAGPNAPLVHQALPELERQAQAEALAAACCWTAPQAPVLPDVLAGAVALLRREPLGQAVMNHALHGDVPAAREAFHCLADQRELPATLAHHLAVIYSRAAFAAEEGGQGELAGQCWRRAWQCWLRVLVSAGAAVGPVRRQDFMSRLLDVHRTYLLDLLFRDEVGAARRHWEAVDHLTALARELAPGLAGEVAECLARFREDVAAACLTAAREVLRNGEAPAGWRAAYEKGLAQLRRLLSLDHDNIRLLTALIDICGDWFFDCYNNEEPRKLWELVDRFTPFALKLARLIEPRPGELAARLALAEFYKYRGFLAPDRASKKALYREAVRFNPENENVRRLLAELENEGEP